MKKRKERRGKEENGRVGRHRGEERRNTWDIRLNNKPHV